MKKVYVKYLSDRILRQLTGTDEKATLSKTPYSNWSVIRQKSESQNGCYKKTKPAKFSEKRTFLTPQESEHFLPPDMHVRIFGGKNCAFFRKFGLLCFLVTPVLRFTLLPYHQ